MSLSVDGVSAWRANVERAAPIRAADPAGGGALLSPWQALMATAALARPDGGVLSDARGDSPARPDRGALSDARGDSPARAADGADGTVPEWRARVEPGPVAPPSPERSSPPRPAVTDDPARIETAAREPKPENVRAEPPGLFQDGEFSFADIIDAINPLQHIPIVSTIYRELTGDRIGHGARMAGGMLFMGPLGGLGALANIVVIEASGKDVGEHAVALFKDGSAPATAMAANESNPKPAVASDRAPSADEQALAELLPPGAIPIAGPNVEFAQAALRPAALAPSPAPQSAPALDNDLPPPPPRGPIAGPGWKGFYSPPDQQSEIVRPTSPATVPPAAIPSATRALAPDPLAQLAVKRTPGALAGAFAAPAGAIGVEGGWFSDVMLDALAKYEDARRLRETQPPEAARREGVNIVN
ncbi:MAG: hypothetical protein FJ311_08005 [Rhodospirillales bacterium]|nr:hypothetical protein [Rhodospirillales bacterium]